MVVGASCAGLSISSTLDPVEVLYTSISRVKREWFKKVKISRERHLCGKKKNLVKISSQRRLGKLVRDDRRATVARITTCPNKSLQNAISEDTTHPSLEADGLQQQKVILGATPVS